MKFSQIVTELQTRRAEVEKELRRLDGAIAALKGLANGRQPRIGRGKRTMSAAGRKKISDAQKARWAKFKKTQRKA